MQLQIQTIKHDLKRQTSQESPARVDSIRELFGPCQVIHPSEALLSQLRQIQLTVKADYHFLNKLRKKTFKTLYNLDYEAEIALIEKAFLAFKQNRIQRKVLYSRQRSLFKRLKQKNQIRKSKQNKLAFAKDYFQSKLVRKLFQEIFFMMKTTKKQQLLLRYLHDSKREMFLNLIKNNFLQSKSYKIHKQQAVTEIQEIYKKKIYEKYFSFFKIFCKYQKLQKKRKYVALQKFIKKLIDAKKQTLTTVQNFKFLQGLKLKRNIFQAMKQTKLQSQCLDWYRCRLQKNHFKKWLQFLVIQKNQKELEESNKIILKHYLQSKEENLRIKTQKKCFNFWKSFARLQKQNKKQTQIIKSFVQLKQKEFLLRKYFRILKQNKNFEKSLNFYLKKLMTRTFQSFRRNLIIESRKLQQIYIFIQNRTVRKYFNGISLFNRQQAHKINSYLLQAAWMKFTLKITAEYFSKCLKAQNYHKTLLKFKSIIAFKENVQLNKKASYCDFYINITLPLKTWLKGFRIRKWNDLRQYQKIKKIFFEWKLLNIRKLLTQSKQTTSSQILIETAVRNNNIKQKESPISRFQVRRPQKLSQFKKEETSFFQKIQENSSNDDEDDIQTKVGTLLTKIKYQKRLKKKQQNILNVTFTEQKNMFTEENEKQTKQKIQNIRMPTWSTPGNDYRVSIFSEDVSD